MKITLTALTLLAPALALPSSEIHEDRPLMRGMTPRATFNEAEGRHPSLLLFLSLSQKKRKAEALAERD